MSAECTSCTHRLRKLLRLGTAQAQGWRCHPGAACLLREILRVPPIMGVEVLCQLCRCHFRDSPEPDAPLLNWLLRRNTAVASGVRIARCVRSRTGPLWRPGTAFRFSPTFCGAHRQRLSLLNSPNLYGIWATRLRERVRASTRERRTKDDSIMSMLQCPQEPALIPIRGACDSLGIPESAV